MFIGGIRLPVSLAARRAAFGGAGSPSGAPRPAGDADADDEDAFAAATWACKNAAELKVDLDRMVVAGDDAGGSLAASLTMMTRDRCGKPLAAQVLISPMLDPSMRLLGDATRLQSDVTAENCAASYRQYLPQTMQRLHVEFIMACVPRRNRAFSERLRVIGHDQFRIEEEFRAKSIALRASAER